jgi:hypothetical protein
VHLASRLQTCGLLHVTANNGEIRNMRDFDA